MDQKPQPGEPALRLLQAVLVELKRAGVPATPLNVIAACTDRTDDQALVVAVAAAAEAQACEVAR